jgi:hypothetical protein
MRLKRNLFLINLDPIQLQSTHQKMGAFFGRLMAGREIKHIHLH